MHQTTQVPPSSIPVVLTHKQKQLRLNSHKPFLFLSVAACSSMVVGAAAVCNQRLYCALTDAVPQMRTDAAGSSSKVAKELKKIKMGCAA